MYIYIYGHIYIYIYIYTWPYIYMADRFSWLSVTKTYSGCKRA